MNISNNIIIKSSNDLIEISDKIYIKYKSLYPIYTDYILSFNFDYGPYISFSDVNYKRNLLCSSDNVDIYIICWKNKQESKIHDHPENGCVMYILNGQLKEDVYEFDEYKKTVNYKNSRTLKETNSSYNSGQHILHKISAEMDTISLHIYCKNYTPRLFS